MCIRDSTWDNDRIGGLVVIVENGKGQIDGVTFEDIEIYKDMGRAFNVTIYGNDIQNCSVQNIVFKNIKYSSLMPSQLKNRFNNDNNSISAEFSNVISDGILINQDNVNNYVFADKYSTLNFNNN